MFPLIFVVLIAAGVLLAVFVMARHVYRRNKADKALIRFREWNSGNVPLPSRRTVDNRFEELHPGYISAELHDLRHEILHKINAQRRS